jgi:hypothetical protein
MAQFEWTEDDFREVVRVMRPRVLLGNTSWAAAAGLLALAVVKHEPQVGSALFGMSLAWFSSAVAYWWRYSQWLQQWLLEDGPHENTVAISERDVSWSHTRVWQRSAIKVRRQGGLWVMERNRQAVAYFPTRVLTADEESILGR